LAAFGLVTFFTTFFFNVPVFVVEEEATEDVSEVSVVFKASSGTAKAGISSFFCSNTSSTTFLLDFGSTMDGLGFSSRCLVETDSFGLGTGEEGGRGGDVGSETAKGASFSVFLTLLTFFSFAGVSGPSLGQTSSRLGTAHGGLGSSGGDNLGESELVTGSRASRSVLVNDRCLVIGLTAAEGAWRPSQGSVVVVVFLEEAMSFLAKDEDEFFTLPDE
jgi:hypothetical protein